MVVVKGLGNINQALTVFSFLLMLDVEVHVFERYFKKRKQQERQKERKRDLGPLKCCSIQSHLLRHMVTVGQAPGCIHNKHLCISAKWNEHSKAHGCCKRMGVRVPVLVVFTCIRHLLLECKCFFNYTSTSCSDFFFWPFLTNSPCHLKDSESQRSHTHNSTEPLPLGLQFENA